VEWLPQFSGVFYLTTMTKKIEETFLEQISESFKTAIENIEILNDEEFRIQRIVVFLYAFYCYNKFSKTINIVKINDYKGCLEIWWNKYNYYDQKCAEMIWEELNEVSENVEHNIF
jgi:hypothetical protein